MTGAKRAAGPVGSGPVGQSAAAAADTKGTDRDRVSVGAYKALTAERPPHGCHDFALAAIERRHGGDLLALVGELVLRTLTDGEGR